MKYFTYCCNVLLVAVASFLTLTGCNSDVFVDADAPTVHNYNISSGESVTVRFNPENLEEVRVELGALTHLDYTTWKDEELRINVSEVTFKSYDLQRIRHVVLYRKDFNAEISVNKDNTFTYTLVHDQEAADKEVKLVMRYPFTSATVTFRNKPEQKSIGS